MDIQSVRNYAIQILVLEHNAQKDKIIFFNKLIDNNLLDQNRLLKACINHYYSSELRKNMYKSSEIILDASIEFEVSTTWVYNCIYKYPHVVLEF